MKLKRPKGQKSIPGQLLNLVELFLWTRCSFKVSLFRSKIILSSDLGFLLFSYCGKTHIIWNSPAYPFFTAYNSVAFSTSAILCTHHLSLVSEPLIGRKELCVHYAVPPSPPSSGPWQPVSFFLSYELHYSMYVKWVESWSICPLVSGFFHLAYYLQGSSMLQRGLEFHSFLRWYSIVHRHILFIHSSTGGHGGCSHLLAIVNRAALNIRVWVLAWIPVLNSWR